MSAKFPLSALLMVWSHRLQEGIWKDVLFSPFNAIPWIQDLLQRWCFSLRLEEELRHITNRHHDLWRVLKLERDELNITDVTIRRHSPGKLHHYHTVKTECKNSLRHRQKTLNSKSVYLIPPS